MIIFSEHSEVIMSETDLRELLDRSFLAGRMSVERAPDVPVTFLCMAWVNRVVEFVRKNPKTLPTVLDVMQWKS